VTYLLVLVAVLAVALQSVLAGAPAWVGLLVAALLVGLIALVAGRVKRGAW
jgi:hypothetical protein